MKIEKERLETTIMLLQQKLNDRNNDHDTVQKNREKRREADHHREETDR